MMCWDSDEGWYGMMYTTENPDHGYIPGMMFDDSNWLSGGTTCSEHR